VLASVVVRYRVRCHAYCLMGNHYHLLLETPEGNLSVAMRQLNGVYTQRFNRRHERCGHVLQGRFGAQLVDGHAYLHEVCRYIVLNPVRAGLVSPPRDWPWSSFRATAGEAPVPGFLTVDWLLDLSGAPSHAAAGRDARSVAAVRDHGYAMREVADFLGRHYVTVSRALARVDGLPSR
jgi:REP element-mobilizing transposase RayT